VGLARALRPVIGVLTWVTNGLLRLIKVEPKEELASAFTAEEVQSIVAESRSQGLIEDEHELLRGALELGERRAADVMVRWESLVTVPLGCTPEDVEHLVVRTGFSRFPVLGTPGEVGDMASPTTTTDGETSEAPGLAEQDVVGYLHIKDLLYADDGRHEVPVPTKRIRALATVGTDEELEDVLAAMQRSGSHLARVVDAAGRSTGVVFLEDVLEELVGEVSDTTRRPHVPGSASRRPVGAP
jgi:CBS domain containing-hemolysin-like protein